MQKIKTMQEIVYPMVLPELIDVDMLLAQVPPQNTSVNADKIKYTLHLLYRKMNSHTRINKEKREGFIPLKAEYVRNIIPHWEHTKNYLIEQGIIECDDDYKEGVTSYGYRIAAKYLNGKTSRSYLESKRMYHVIEENIGSESAIRERLKKERFYLLDSLVNGSITIDKEKAFECIDAMIDQERLEILGNNNYKHRAKTVKVDDLEFNREHQREKIIKICEGDLLDFSDFDETGYRFHTPITNMVKECREFIKIDEEKIVTLDLKNSQPFLFLLFIHEDFLKKNTQNSIIRLKDINREYHEYVTGGKYVTGGISQPGNKPYMMSKSFVTRMNKGFRNSGFYGLVVEGRFYDSFLIDYEKVSRDDPEWHNKRDGIKRKFMSYFFDITRNPGGGLRGYIDHRYPEVSQTIRLLKGYVVGQTKKVRTMRRRKESDRMSLFTTGRVMRSPEDYMEVDAGFTSFVITLQRIESHIFLDRICGRLHNEYPQMNYFTIHDSIAVAQSNRDIVRKIMEEEILKATGIMPKLEIS